MTSAVVGSLNEVMEVVMEVVGAAVMEDEEEEGEGNRRGWEEVRRSFWEVSEMVLSVKESSKAPVEERRLIEAVAEWRLCGTRCRFLEFDGVIRAEMILE